MPSNEKQNKNEKGKFELKAFEIFDFRCTFACDLFAYLCLLTDPICPMRMGMNNKLKPA